jgi:hypothetical protein
MVCCYGCISSVVEESAIWRLHEHFFFNACLFEHNLFIERPLLVLRGTC